LLQVLLAALQRLLVEQPMARRRGRYQGAIDGDPLGGR
jgi:hypothetical protein